MKNTVFPHKFWRPYLDCMPQLFFRPQYVWFPVHLKGHLIPLCYETLVVNWQNLLFTLFHQSRSVLSPNPINSSVPGRCGCDIKCVNFNHILGIDILSNQVNVTLEQMPNSLIDSKSMLVQLMALCHQATSHYLNQYWPESPTSYDVILPQWIELSAYFELTLALIMTH